MKKSTGGLQYVKDFSFPADQGFTGSAGVTNVKGYMRGGAVKGRNKPNRTPKRAKGTTAAAQGGMIGDAPGQQKMGFQGGDRQINVDGVGITVPRARGGRAKHTSTHDKLMKHGKKMGYKQGGQVKVRDSIGNDPSDIGLKKYDPSPKDKNTSGRFKQKRGKMDSMDHGNQPARRGANARSQQDRESGGTGRLRPGLKKGGKVKKYAKGGKAVTRDTGDSTPLETAARVITSAHPAGRVAREAYENIPAVRRVVDKGRRALERATGTGRKKASKKAGKKTSRRRTRSPDHTKGKGKSRKGMPKNVKARGGEVHMGEGGYYGKPGDKYPNKGARQTMPKNVKARGGVVGKHGADR